MFLGLLDPDPLVRGMDLDPAPNLDPSITKQKSKKNLDSYHCFVTSFDFLSLKMMYMYLQKVISKKLFKFFFFWHLGKVNDENSRIRIRIR
jgi:hypothetical protein